VSGSQVATVTASQDKSLTKSQVTTENSAVGNQKDTSSLSSLSRQLSGSAVRAAARDSGLSRNTGGFTTNERRAAWKEQPYHIDRKPG